jgi:myosin heavy subunit
VNPYKHIPHIYGAQALEVYTENVQLLCGIPTTEWTLMPPQPAHIYRLAGEAYLNLVVHKKRFALLIVFALLLTDH